MTKFSKEWLEGLYELNTSYLLSYVMIKRISDRLNEETIKRQSLEFIKTWYTDTLGFLITLRFSNVVLNHEIKTKEFHDEIRRLSKWFEEEYPELILVWGKNNVN